MSNNIRQRVTELETTIMNAQTELYRLQAECKHPTHFVGMFMWRVGAFNPSRICCECGSTVPGITEEESKTVWDSWGKPTTAGITTIIQGDENSPTVSFFSTTSG